MVDHRRHDATDWRRGRRCRRGVVLQRRGQRGMAPEAALPLLGQTTLNGPAEAAWNRPVHLMGRPRLLVGHRHQQRHEIGLVEGRVSGDELVQGGADAVDVRACIHLVAAELLGRGIRRRPDDATARHHPGLGARVGGDRNAEVPDLDAPLLIHEAVGRLHVTMQDAGRRRRVESRDDLEHGVDRHCGRQPAAMFQPVGQRFPHELHGDDQALIELPGPEDVDAIRVVQRGGEPTLLQEAGAVDLAPEPW